MNKGRAILVLLLVAVLSVEAHSRRRPVKAPPVVTFDASAINAPNQPDTVPGDKGSAVVRAQILLARAHFSCGEIDGHFGSNLRKALSAFQAERNLPPLGSLDAAAWP